MDEQSFAQGFAKAFPTGMDLRDWFAGQAIAAMLLIAPVDSWDAGRVARAAYDYADAMIRESRK